MKTKYYWHLNLFKRCDEGDFRYKNGKWERTHLIAKYEDDPFYDDIYFSDITEDWQLKEALAGNDPFSDENIDKYNYKGISIK